MESEKYYRLCFHYVRTMTKSSEMRNTGVEGYFSSSLSSAVSVLCHADNDFLCTSEGMSSQAQLNNLPTGYAAVDFAMTAIPWIVP